MSGLSSRDVAEIVGVPESRVRYWAQIGLVGPTYRDVENGVEAPRPSYAFNDLVAARAARELTERGIPARRVREAIATLRAQLPALDRPLLHLRVLSDGERLVVVGDQPYEPLTGQRVMDFALEELSQKLQKLGQGRPVTPIHEDATVRHEPASGPTKVPTALDWFERGLTHMVCGERTAAIDAYRTALALDENLGPAHANLAILLAESGAFDEADAANERAMLHDPTGPEARANQKVIAARRRRAL